MISQVEEIKQNFLTELQDAASGKKTSLPFIKHQLSSQPLVHNGETFQVIVIGGSVFHKALVKKDNGSVIIIKDEREELERFSSGDSFLNFFSRQIYKDVPLIALNFAYPLLPEFINNMLDGILVSGSKENAFTGLVGKKVGKTIEEHVLKTSGKRITVSVANDTICLLLSGLGAYSKESIAGTIMGTGTNIAFFFDDYAVNLESAEFDKFFMSNETKEIDKKSVHPEKSLFEKEVSGAYLYHHFNLLTKKRMLDVPPINSTRELLKLAIESDQTETQTLAKYLLEKSAAYFAAQLAGMALFKKRDMTCIMEGSLYWENPLYKQFVEEYIKTLSPEYKISIIKVENSSIIGGAMLIA